MKKVAIVYDTVSGSTGEISKVLREELQTEFSVTSLLIGDVTSLDPFDAVLVGSPMRFGKFTSRMRKFLKRNRSALVRKQVTYFFSTLYLVQIAEEPLPEPPLYVDPGLAMATLPKRKTTAMDRTHSLGYYERCRRKGVPDIDPVSIAYFKGRLVLSRLPLVARLFMRIVTTLTTKEQEGEFLNPASVRDWGAGLIQRLR
jgi:menaquinone-dependent protoporphyrinogen IX oxidase